MDVDVDVETQLCALLCLSGSFLSPHQSCISLLLVHNAMQEEEQRGCDSADPSMRVTVRPSWMSRVGAGIAWERNEDAETV